MNAAAATTQTTDAKPAAAWRAYTGITSGAVTEKDLIERFLPLVRNVVDRIKMTLPLHIDADDLYSVGVTGLLAAVRKYDPEQGNTFASYAAMRIRGAVLDELRRMDWCPRRTRARARKLKESINQLEQKIGRTANEDEICEALGLSHKEYAKWLEEVRPVTFIALDQHAEGEESEGASLHELLADETDKTGRDSLEKTELLQLLTQRMAGLPDIPRKIIAMYYFENMRLAEIAEVFGLTESRICQIHSQTILGLRSFLGRAQNRFLKYMLIIVGSVIVFAATLGGFMMAGGHPGVLLHLSEFVVILGIPLGVLIIATPIHVIKEIIHKTKDALAGKTAGKKDFFDLLKLLYELFMMGRRNGLIALEEHVMDPPKKTVFQKYPSLLNHHERLHFLCNGLKPVIDGKIKPDQLENLMSAELKAKETEMAHPVHALQMIGDSLPAIGIVAAVLGIINTMAAIADGPEAVGEKVAAALTGTLMGIFFAYGFVNPLAGRITSNNASEMLCLNCIMHAVAGFAKGLAPLTAVEVARRSLDSSVQPGAEELKTAVKNLGK